MKPFYRRAQTFSSKQPKEDKEATVSQLAMDRGRHHSLTMVWARTDFLLFSCSTGKEHHIGISGRGH